MRLMPTLRLATRRSKLALAQARAYARTLCARHRELQIEEVHIVTSGDRIQDKPLTEIGGKGLFIKEIEEALLDGRADFAVHSIKDVPAELAPGLYIGAVPEREDARDALVGKLDLTSLAAGARVGTSSLRRKTLLLQVRPDVEVVPLRGNVDTRLRKLDEGELDAIVLAYAGLKRLGLEARALEVIDPDIMLPAIGQGALGIECREDDDAVRTLLGATDHAETHVRVDAERGFMAAVGGSCQLPVAAYAVRDGQELWLRGFVAEPDGSLPRASERWSPWPASSEEAARLGRELAATLST
jgi:hydroxymethylbilane synthase